MFISGIFGKQTGQTEKKLKRKVEKHSHSGNIQMEKILIVLLIRTYERKRKKQYFVRFPFAHAHFEWIFNYEQMFGGKE